MIQGKTKSGFAFQVDKKMLNDMRLLRLLAKLQKGDVLTLPDVCEKMLGADQAEALYCHVEDDGRVPVDRVQEELLEIISEVKNGKN